MRTSPKTRELKTLEELVALLGKMDKASRLGIRKTADLERMKKEGAFRKEGVKFEPMTRLENLEFDYDSPKLFESWQFRNSILEATGRLEQADAEEDPPPSKATVGTRKVLEELARI
mgnify:FL=1